MAKEPILRERETAMRPAIANYIDGQWTASGETYEKRGPWRPSEIIAECPASGRAEVEAAVAAAAAAFPTWAAMPAPQRGAILLAAAAALERRLESMAQDMTLEMGKPLREARLESARVVSIFRFFAGEGWRSKGEIFEQSANGNLVYTVRRPLGVIGLITPWNFPAAIPAWKAAPALAYGNSVVLKLAQDAPLTGLHIAAALHEAGIPPGVFNVVIGRGSAAGTPLVTHPEVRAISFTGSVGVGAQIRQQATALGKPCQLELGGHNPLIVMADADVDAAVEAAYAGAFWSAGQKCTATRRIYAQREIYNQFRAKLLARMKRGKVGDPSDPETEVGPIVTEGQMSEVLDSIARGKAEGGRLLSGGDRIDTEAFLVAPTLFEGVADDAFLSCEEVFGPVASLYSFGEIEEAIHRANDVPFGLSAAIYTTNLRTSSKFVRELEAGILHINSQTAGADIHIPFGGVKSSGWGPHEQGRAAIDFYSEISTVYQDL